MLGFVSFFFVHSFWPNRTWYEAMKTLAFCACLLVAIQLHLSRSNSVECLDSQSCINSTIVAMSTSLGTLSAIECYGYKSCSFASIESKNAVQIDCYGSFACYRCTLIKHELSNISDIDAIVDYDIFRSNFANINCFGLFSCAIIGTVLNRIGNIWCLGELSCFGSNISFFDGNLYCNGDRSCMSSIVTSNGGNSYIYGNLATMNAIFYSNFSSHDTTTTRTHYYFYGSNSGYNSSIFCGNEQTCVIICDSNACNNINKICLFCVMNICFLRFAQLVA